VWLCASSCQAPRQELLPDIRVTQIEPGAVATELPNHITQDETRQGVQLLYSQAEVTAADVAEIIDFVLSRPPTWPSTRSCSAPPDSSDTHPLDEGEPQCTHAPSAHPACRCHPLASAAWA
jgi:hypothetical protein